MLQRKRSIRRKKTSSITIRKMEEGKENTNQRPIILYLLLLCIAVGVWVNVYQNTKVKTVYVKSGNVEARIEGTPDVNVSNQVDVNLDAINGYDNAFFNNPSRGDYHSYYCIPVSAN